MREPIDAQNQPEKEGLNSGDNKEAKGRTKNRSKAKADTKGKEELDKG